MNSSAGQFRLKFIKILFLSLSTLKFIFSATFYNYTRLPMELIRIC